MLTLDPMQEEAKNQIPEFLKNHRSVLVLGSTGFGKTVLASGFIRDHLLEIEEALREDKDILILVPLQNLIPQFYQTLTDFELNPAVLHDEVKRDDNGKLFNRDINSNVIITMPTTLLNTLDGSNKLQFRDNFNPSIIILDEAHKATSSYYQRICNEIYPNAKLVGFTATAYRVSKSEGEQLDAWYSDRLIKPCSMKELFATGRLVKPKYLKATSGNIVQEWLDKAAGKQTIVFTSRTDKSVAIVKAFNDAGIKAEIITAGSDVGDVKIKQTTPGQRREIFNRFDKGETKVLVSIYALGMGFNRPAAEVCMFDRNIDNHALYHQGVGRVLRAHPGKTSALVIDFYDNIIRHGYVEEYEWTIEKGKISTGSATDGDVITKESYDKAERFYCVCKCFNVFDIKKNANCPECEKHHDIKFITTKFEQIRKIADVKDAYELRAFAERFFAISDINPELLAVRYVAMKKFNDRAIIPVFNLQTGELREEVKFLPKLLKTRIDANLPYEVSID